MAPSAWKFQAVPGVFQDFLTHDPRSKVATQPRLGLLHRAYPTDGTDGEGRTASDLNPEPEPECRDWPRFTAYVRSLNRQAPEGVRYKVLYLTRHGVGFHNLKHTEVGTEAWNNYWSLLNGDDKTTWFDSFLAPEGQQQARDLSAFWSILTTQHGAPLPQTIYTSPLARCLQTTDLVLRPLMPRPFRAVIKEGLRERWTTHTCDQRRPRAWIEEHWCNGGGGEGGDRKAGYVLEDGFDEEDELVKRMGPRAETDEEHEGRKRAVLEGIWEADGGEFLALVCHSIAIRSIQAVCGAAPFRVREGTSIAMLVRGEKTT